MRGKHLEELWSVALIAAAVVMFLYMAFAWAVVYVLIVAKTLWYIPAILIWPLDVWSLNKLLKYAGRKWGKNGGK